MPPSRTISPDDVLDAAERVLAHDGPAALSMRRLAEEIGTSYQVVYTRVGDKGAVARALHDRGFARVAGLRAVGEASPVGNDDLVAVAHGYVRFAVEHPRMFELMFASPIEELVRDEALRRVEWRAFRSCWVGPCQRWLREHGRAAGDGQAVRLAWRLWSAVHGATVLHLAGHPSPAGDVLVDVGLVVRRLLGDPD